MVSTGNGEKREEIQEDLGTSTPLTNCGNKDQIVIQCEASQVEKLDEKIQSNKFLSMLKTLPIKSGFMRFSAPDLSSPSAKFRQIADEREQMSRSVSIAASPDSSRHSRVPFAKKIDWGSLIQMSKEWIKNPMNMALFAWIVCVAVSGAILFMVMIGMLNRVLPKKSQRDTWFEVNNQILNALFTLMCLYQHPQRFYHLALLCRWQPEDIIRLRRIYCKNGTYKPREWMHMMVVVVLLHINCFAQYALCGLNWGYPRSKRPPIGVGICISVAIAAPAVATVYNILSPLGKEYDIIVDQEAQSQIVSINGERPAFAGFRSLERRFSFVAREDRRLAEAKPEWIGGLFDLWDDISLAYLSIFCSFCVFGWNMERLGFGNMYVHIATFLLLCIAPFWIFNLAAININNEVVREALGLTGILLCVLGLLYGGFWRIQMRKKYNLPENKLCCRNPAVTDCLQWLFCCSCSLAQEVRTADFYNIIEDKFYLKQTGDGSLTPMLMSPLRGDDGPPLVRTNQSSPLWGSSSPSVFKSVNSPSPSRFLKVPEEDARLGTVKDDTFTKDNDTITSPPLPSVILKQTSM